ncbi:hypothetical protein BZA05DRAFT_133787 [Tricharina praecox]|uniref:uncharacterized protein n=1 Tax=Tricharina praecox TaxID=43433 RepID=UPI00221EE308|nr:uncharacterized protein BZA05DRAFT_133787 [Tricharina praecox]KAI5846688.1 hypothetical protein BZA05DRAFT_133787 [Tricharina praecox]
MVQCGVCTRLFSTASALEDHANTTNHRSSKARNKNITVSSRQLVIASPRRLSCHLCDRTFSDAEARQVHLNSPRHMAKCDFCEQLFPPSSKALEQHVQRQHPSCKPCNRTFVSAKALLSHQNSPRHMEKCVHCEQLFPPSSKALEQHVQRQHPSCKPCNRTFVSAKALLSHQNSPRHMEKCVHCEQLFPPSSKALEQHMRMAHVSYTPSSRTFFSQLSLQPHLSPPQHKSGCAFCDESFTVGTNELERHMQSAHPSCEPCSRAFVDHETLQRHLDSSCHTERCGICDESFTIGTKGLKRHMRVAHPSCKPCNRTFVSPASLQIHLNSARHTEKCHLCDELFRSDTDGLERHLRSEHPSCEPCSCTFVSKEALLRHLATSALHAHEFRCTICDAEFATGRALREHTCVDPEEIDAPAAVVVRNFCDECEGQFRTKDAYEQHMAVVHKIVRDVFQCPSCQKTFPTLSAWAQHLESGVCAGSGAQEIIDRIVNATNSTSMLAGGSRGHAVEDNDNETSRSEDSLSDFDDESGYRDDNNGNNGVVIHTPTSTRPPSSLSISPDPRASQLPFASQSSGSQQRLRVSSTHASRRQDAKVLSCTESDDSASECGWVAQVGDSDSDSE